jgi:hypothetical protein
MFIIPSTSSLPSKLTDVEELFVYKFLSNINLTPSVHFYVDQKRPDCLLIATADGSTNTEEKYFTANCYPHADLKSFNIEQIIQIRIIEIIFCIKDLISNQNNYGWLYPSKKLFIIDFSIDKNEISKANPTLASAMLSDGMSTDGRVHIASHISKFKAAILSEKKSIACRAIEPLIGSFVESIDPTFESINDFICANSYAFDVDIEMVRLKLKKIAERTRTRWEELTTFIGLKKMNTKNFYFIVGLFRISSYF